MILCWIKEVLKCQSCLYL